MSGWVTLPGNTRLCQHLVAFIRFALTRLIFVNKLGRLTAPENCASGIMYKVPPSFFHLVSLSSPVVYLSCIRAAHDFSFTLVITLEAHLEHSLGSRMLYCCVVVANSSVNKRRAFALLNYKYLYNLQFF